MGVVAGTAVAFRDGSGDARVGRVGVCGGRGVRTPCRVAGGDRGRNACVARGALRVPRLGEPASARDCDGGHGSARLHACLRALTRALQPAVGWPSAAHRRRRRGRDRRDPRRGWRRRRVIRRLERNQARDVVQGRTRAGRGVPKGDRRVLAACDRHRHRAHRVHQPQGAHQGRAGTGAGARGQSNARDLDHVRHHAVRARRHGREHDRRRRRPRIPTHRVDDHAVRLRHRRREHGHRVDDRGAGTRAEGRQCLRCVPRRGVPALGHLVDERPDRRQERRGYGRRLPGDPRVRAAQHLARLTFWSVNRDRACAKPATKAADDCSGVAQVPYAFTSVVTQYAG